MLEVKRNHVRECISHLRMSKEFQFYAWNIIQAHKSGYATPRIPYLLEAILFDDQCIVLDETCEIKEEQILFSVLECIRKKQVRQK